MNIAIKPRKKSGAKENCRETQHHLRNGNTCFYFERPRLNDLFMEAVGYPLVIVCAGAGYGKTSAVLDFTHKYQADTAWIQISAQDNAGARFWENFTHSIAKINEPFAREISKLGFPDTTDKLNQYLAMVRNHAEIRHRVFVMDDFHLIEDLSVIRFVECAFNSMPPGNSLFLISRSTPSINTADLISRGRVFNVNESDLRFSEKEFAQYFRLLDISLQPDIFRKIMHDTEGWAFAINLIAQSYQKAPGYGGYLRNAMKTNIFKVMETETWNRISRRLQNFMIRLSLIGHLSVDLIELLAGGDNGLIAELERQYAYVRRDIYINAYLIHPLFLEFLSAKEDLLSEEQKKETYAIAGDWCNKNDFKIDAMSYFEKVGDYKSMVTMFFALPAQIPKGLARYAALILGRAPENVFDTVEFLASTHIRSIMCQGLWEKSIDLAKQYEAKYLKLPKDDPFRKLSLGSIYYCWAIARSSMCLTDDCYDFDLYFEKLDKYLSEPVDPGNLIKLCPGPWICALGSSRKGAPEEFIGALRRSIAHLSHCFKGLQTGEEDLAMGELKFYQGDIRSAETLITRALNRAQENRQFEFIHRAQFYALRIAIIRGNYTKAEQALKDMKTYLDENEYANSFINYDISQSWYNYTLDLPEKVSPWLKENFSAYDNASFIENYGNQIKAKFCYMTRDFPPLLAYIEEMKRRESFLFERLEMLAMEACVHYKMKDKKSAFAVFKEAYENAAPNSLILPFIELGKDMRTLTGSALKEPGINIPIPWLEAINRKAASYAKRQAHVIVKYKQAAGIVNSVAFSPRETEILTDLSHGLTRAEIAASCNLSVNTVKMVINMIYAKVGAENLADLIRIAIEKKLV